MIEIDSKYFASASKDRRIRVWNSLNGSCKRTLEGHTRTVNCLLFLEHLKLLVSGSRDETIRLWNIEKRVCTKVLKNGANVMKVLYLGDTIVELSEEMKEKEAQK
mmetsp:Transcript_48711/g.35856  ORF Transcript_48711/g.35856 Transcript_48711/m.35856 type:complete len:105 (+) Transcript_48711:1401-1715(+)